LTNSYLRRYLNILILVAHFLALVVYLLLIVSLIDQRQKTIKPEPITADDLNKNADRTLDSPDRVHQLETELVN